MRKIRCVQCHLDAATAGGAAKEFPIGNQFRVFRFPQRRNSYVRIPRSRTDGNEKESRRVSSGWGLGRAGGGAGYRTQRTVNVERTDYSVGTLLRSDPLIADEHNNRNVRTLSTDGNETEIRSLRAVHDWHGCV